jgi:hypothetical protein
VKNLLAAIGIIILSTGCSSMLPTKHTTTHAQWDNYSQLHTIIHNVRAGLTLEDVKSLGIDVDKTKNIEVLTHLDVARRFGLIGLKDDSLKVPEGVQAMVNAAERGRGYELTVQSTVEVREGSFWKDFLQFKRITRTTGWKFSVLLITVDNKIVYVLHKGNPNINSLTIEKNPLGPFQSLNGYVLVDVLEDVIK